MTTPHPTRMLITTDWDAGFSLTPEAKPLDDVPPGGEYVVECTPSRDIMLTDVTIRDFDLDRLYVGTAFAQVVSDEVLVATGSVDDRRYRLDPPVAVAKTCDVRAVLKNTSGEPKKPKVAVLIPDGQEVAKTALQDWRVVGVRTGSAARSLSPSCPTCDSPNHETRRMIDGATTWCRDAWHGDQLPILPPEKIPIHVPKLARTLHDGPGNATLVQGCSCGAEIATTRAFAGHVGVSERAVDAMMGLVSVIYDLCDHPARVTREEVARRVTNCLKFTQPREA
jgi:hypothetical protein